MNIDPSMTRAEAEDKLSQMRSELVALQQRIANAESYIRALDGPRFVEGDRVTASSSSAVEFTGNLIACEVVETKFIDDHWVLKLETARMTHFWRKDHLVIARENYQLKKQGQGREGGKTKTKSRKSKSSSGPTRVQKLLTLT